MSWAAAAQATAFARYLRRVRASCQITDIAPPDSSIVTLWHEWILCGAAVACGMPNVAVYVWEQPGQNQMLRVLGDLGVKVILSRAENNRGVRELRKWLSEASGRVVAIALDGPNGPRRVAKPGVVHLARIAGAPLRPLLIDAPAALELETWDRCAVPAVGGEIRLRLLDPVPTHLSHADAACAIEQQLNRQRQNPLRNRPGLDALPYWVWARLCTLPLEFGNLTLGPAHENGAIRVDGNSSQGALDASSSPDAG